MYCCILIGGGLCSPIAFGRGYAWGEATGVLPSSGCMIVYNNINNIIVSGEAILSAENSGKPLKRLGLGSNPAGGPHSAPQTP